ncbi:solute carrier family 28 member 3-like [Pomacea canaliculata]|uniref:solute carrier family 28 member 3-like n=1 Tax=Pomacea canaliculata TaxID=400727 RepID=UPI000D72F7F1|nr:solute carrier family 28 member 3-like [Pomacea canaliculata]
MSMSESEEEPRSTIQLVSVIHVDKPDFDNVSASTGSQLPLSNGDGANVTLQITTDHVTPERKDNSQWHKLCFLHRVNHFIRRSVHTRWMVVRKLLQVALLLLYVAYFSYAMYHKSSGEPALRLLVFTVIGAVVLVRRLLARLGLCGRPACVGQLLDRCRERGIHIRKIIKWTLYFLSTGGAVAFLIVEIAIKHPRNLISLVGLAVLLLICYLISVQPEKVNWHAVYWGMALQFWFAVIIRRTSFGSSVFEWLADRVVEFLSYTDKGSEFVFGRSYRDHFFVFQVMPTIIFFNSAIVMLYHLGVIQIFVAKFGSLMSFCLGTSPIESVNTASNLFLSMTESTVLIQPFIGELTKSELFAVMTGGFASIAGFLLGAFSAYGAPIDHLLTASVMSAPAALAFAKLLFPDERPPSITAKDAYTVALGHSSSLLGALSHGASQGLKMASNVVINQIVYIALLEFLNMTLMWFAERVGVEGFTFSDLMAYIMYPLTYTMGFETQDCFKMAGLLAHKILTTTMLSYVELGHLITNNRHLANYVETTNGTWRHLGDDISLMPLTQLLSEVSSRKGLGCWRPTCCADSVTWVASASQSERSCRCPQRIRDVIKHAPFALLAGNFASFSTACVAGLLFTD